MASPPLPRRRRLDLRCLRAYHPVRHFRNALILLWLDVPLPLALSFPDAFSRLDLASEVQRPPSASDRDTNVRLVDCPSWTGARFSTAQPSRPRR